MKKIYASLIAALLLIGFTGCKKEKFDTSPFRFKLDGEEFYALSSTSSAKRSGNRIIIKGTKPVDFRNKSKLYGEVEIDFYINPDSLLNPVTLNYGTNILRYGNNNFDKTFYSQNATPGVLRFTEFNTSTKKISGTFEAVIAESSGANSKVISEGKFNLTYGE
jgi:hypothetical protein